jgi:aminomethyltransferase
METGGGSGLVPAGLASRDTLRLEAGMPLYGHELGLETFPAQAGLGRVVNLKKEGNFVGREAVEAGAASGARVLVGLESDGKRAGRAGYQVYASAVPEGSTVPEVPEGAASSASATEGAASSASATEGVASVGEITSGALSPTLGHPIAMAYVDPAFATEGTPLEIDVRGTRIAASVIALPFYKRETTR